jgi:hypothetical protein
MLNVQVDVAPVLLNASHARHVVDVKPRLNVYGAGTPPGRQTTLHGRLLLSEVPIQVCKETKAFGELLLALLRKGDLGHVMYGG